MAKNEASAFAKAAQAVLDEYGDDPEACADKIKALAKVFADQAGSRTGKGRRTGKSSSGYNRGPISDDLGNKIKAYLRENNGDYEGAGKKFKRKPSTLKDKFTEKGNDRKAKTE